MPAYNLPVVRTRTALFNPICEVQERDDQSCITDLLVHLLIGRVTSSNGRSHELTPIFNASVNALELDIPESFLNALEEVGIGPNLQRFFNWLNRLDPEDLQDLQSDVTTLQSDVTTLQSQSDVVRSSAYRVVIADTTVLITDRTLIVKADSAITLPAANTAAGLDFIVKNLGNNSVTITPDGVETIDDETGALIINNYESLTIFCDGTEWSLI